ncbi:MAG: peptidylprolyl isomerase [Spirochaetota bacterium]|nr:peptidylprolyl isomerase [Spirochaetota bacterium]
MKKKYALIIFCILLITNSNAFSWEIYDRVIAIVNDIPIIESEVLSKLSRLQKIKKINKGKIIYEKSRLLDKFIDDTLVCQTAKEEYIIVSEKKIDHQIDKIMKSMNLTSIEEFKKRIEASEKMSFKDYKEELRISIITEQVMSIAIGVSPPSEKDGIEWYEKNKKKLGYQVKLKHILVKPNNNSIAEEKRVNKQINKLRRLIVSGKSFEEIAQAHSEDSSTSKRGGDLGWVNIAELDPYFASQVDKIRKIGKISGVIKSNYGYHIVKYLGRRSVPYGSVANKILNLLYNQRMMEQFRKWVLRRRRESEIKIYMEDYVRG